MRKKALGISKKLYKKARNIKEKKEIIRIFEEATRWPDQGAPEGDREFENIMAEDIKDILSFYAIALKNDENEAIQEIEKHLAFLERNPRQKTPKTALIAVPRSSHGELGQRQQLANLTGSKSWIGENLVPFQSSERVPPSEPVRTIG